MVINPDKQFILFTWMYSVRVLTYSAHTPEELGNPQPATAQPLRFL